MIESNPADNRPISQLARLCGVGETRFRQLFLQYSGGISPVEYRNRLRIDYAEKYLYSDLVTVEYAALASGFNDLSHFYRTYKKYKGVSPHAGIGKKGKARRKCSPEYCSVCIFDTYRGTKVPVDSVKRYVGMNGKRIFSAVGSGKFRIYGAYPVGDSGMLLPAYTVSTGKRKFFTIRYAEIRQIRLVKAKVSYEIVI